MNPLQLQRSAGALAIGHALLFLVPLLVLGAAIGWPANLDLPAAHNLPLVLSQAFSIKLGYGSYLLYSALFWPTVLLISRALAGPGEPPLLLQLAVGFALLSTLARCLGIVRWLSVMPVLATQYGTADAARQADIALGYDAFNAYAGRVGEGLGVFFFAAASLWLLGLHLWQARSVPRWLAGMGLLVAAGLSVLAAELFGPDLSPLIAPVGMLYMLWMVCLGVHIIRHAHLVSRPGSATPAPDGR